MADEQLTVAIFGATGTLGPSIVAAFSQPQVRKHIRSVIAFSRHANKLERWRSQKNITLRTYTVGTIKEALVGVDVVINVVNTSDAHFHTTLVKAMAGLGTVKVYFPSEFGIDRSILDFRHEAFERCRGLSQLAQDTLGNTKVCHVYVGFFLETILGPALGLVETVGNDVRFMSIGSKKTPISCTSIKDTGRSVAQLALLKPSQIPEVIHFGGTTYSLAQMAEIMAKESGDKINVVELTLSDYKASILVSHPSNPVEYIRFVIGEGKVNHGKGGLWNDNELVNPGQTRWRWTTMEDLAKETGGRPWLSNGNGIN